MDAGQALVVEDQGHVGLDKGVGVGVGRAGREQDGQEKQGEQQARDAWCGCGAKPRSGQGRPRHGGEPRTGAGLSLGGFVGGPCPVQNVNDLGGSPLLKSNMKAVPWSMLKTVNSGLSAEP